MNLVSAVCRPAGHKLTKGNNKNTDKGKTHIKKEKTHKKVGENDREREKTLKHIGNVHTKVCLKYLMTLVRKSWLRRL
jgi:hypothetical protein